MRTKFLYLLMVLVMVLGFSGVMPAAAQEHSQGVATASDLRVRLVSQLGEHVLLASSATGAALAGREAQFQAVVAALDGNSVDISKSIGLVYGAEAESAFLELWRKHINIVVDYTNGLAMKDQAKQEQAVNALLAYAGEFGTFLNKANPDLSQEEVTELVKMHILTLKDVIDAQAASDQPLVYSSLREAYGHMGMFGTTLASKIAQQFPDRFSGSAEAPDASLRMMLTMQFQEHVYLAAVATGAALGGREAQFQAAAGALDANSVDVSKSIGLVYGAEAESDFLELWRKHIGFVVDYTNGLAMKDQAKQEQAVNALLAYTPEFGAFLNTANPNLPKETVSDLVKTHILTLKDVIDAQAAGDQAQVYSRLREAYGHMTMVADPVAGAISQQFPDRFGSGTPAVSSEPMAEMPAAEAPAALPTTGGEMPVPVSLYVMAAVVVALTLGLVLMNFERKGR